MHLEQEMRKRLKKFRSRLAIFACGRELRGARAERRERLAHGRRIVKRLADKAALGEMYKQLEASTASLAEKWNHYQSKRMQSRD